MLIGFLAVSLLAAGRAAAVNEFNVNFPTSFSFNTTTKFFWGDGQGTDLTGLLVVGDTNPAVSYSLPLDSSACKKATIVGGVQNCVQFANNGTALFGGPYAANLVLGSKYHLVLQYTSPDLSSEGTSNSPVFTMVNPIASVPSSTTKSTSAKPSSTQPSSATRSRASSSIVRTSSSGRLSSSPTTSLTSRATASSSPVASTTTSATPPASSTTPEGEGLTPGAKAGIAIGVLALVALASVAAYFLYRRRRANKTKKKEEEARRRGTTGTNFQDIDILLGSPVSRYEGGAGWKKKRGTPQAVGNTAQPRSREGVGLQGQGTPF
ncbi:hypothetical protein LZ554_007778 [Drepanopeziza brunnea f. sp. 'monogermtubi']|nr:hypothetical protein LZ554_007778 [Drepanopeziza brunnea f. sp. 'monogermtubi']